MAGAPKEHRPARLINLRVAGVAIAVLAMLIYLNITQLNDDNFAALRASMILVPDMDRALVERRQIAETNAWYEYSLLVAAGLGVLCAVAGPAVIRRFAKEIDR